MKLMCLPESVISFYEAHSLTGSTTAMSIISHLTTLKKVSSLLELWICSSVPTRYSNSLNSLVLVLDMVDVNTVSCYYPLLFTLSIVDSSYECSTGKFVSTVEEISRAPKVSFTPN